MEIKEIFLSNNCLENVFTNRCINCLNWLSNDVVNIVHLFSSFERN